MFDALNSARSRTQRQIRTALACSEYLFAKNVGVPAVVSVLSQHVHVDPSQRQWTSPISMDEVICAQVRNSLPRPGTRFQVGLPHRGDGVGLTEIERLVRSVLDPRLSTGLAGDGLLEPDTLDKGRVLQQAQQRRLGRNEPLTGFCLSEPIETSGQHLTMFVDEGGQLLPVSGAETRGFVDVHSGTLACPTGASRQHMCACLSPPAHRHERASGVTPEGKDLVKHAGWLWVTVECYRWRASSSKLRTIPYKTNSQKLTGISLGVGSPPWPEAAHKETAAQTHQRHFFSSAPLICRVRRLSDPRRR